MRDKRINERGRECHRYSNVNGNHQDSIADSETVHCVAFR